VSLTWLLTQKSDYPVKNLRIILIKLWVIHIRMLFSMPYPTPYPEHHFKIEYLYLSDSLKSNIDTLKRIRRQFRLENYLIRLKMPLVLTHSYRAGQRPHVAHGKLFPFVVERSSKFNLRLLKDVSHTNIFYSS
jgi:hypothetical protein